MKRRDFLRDTALAGSGLLAGHSMAKSLAGNRPNLLFVFSDQHSWDMLGCYGNDQIRTPHLDRFASQGVQFNHCVSTTPLCSPMRAMLMTGKYPLRNAVVRNGHDLWCNPGESFGEVLKANGYRTGYVGKWHLLGGNRNRPVPYNRRYGFEDWFYSNNCHCDYHPDACFYYDPETGEKIMFNEWEQVGQTRQALKFLEECDGEDPFALFVSWHPPHNHDGLNYDAPDELEALYPKDQIHLRPDAVDQRSDRLLTEYQGYMALISSIDECFGKLMAKLEERGLAENTIVVFTADHGDMMRYKPGTPIEEFGNPRYRMFKVMPHPTSCRVPMLVRWPGRLDVRQSDLLFGSMDIMPTVLGLMRLPVPGGLDGKNLSAAITEKDDEVVDFVPLSIFSGRGWRGIYTRNHIYAFEMRPLNPGEVPQFPLLINHRKDPYALDDWYNDSEHAELQAELHQRTLAWMKHIGDEGWSYNQICNAALKNPQESKHIEAPGHKMENKGCPLELLKASGMKGKFS